MAKIISNEGKAVDKKKMALYGGGFFIILVIALWQLLGDSSSEVVLGVKDTTGSGLTNQNIEFDGNAKEIDQEVKEEKVEKIKNDREKALKENKTVIEAVPIDQEYIKETENFNPQQILEQENVPCITSEYDAMGFHCKTKLDRDGFDKNGFDKNGFGKDGCSQKGLDISGKPCGSFLNKQNNECLNKLIANCEESKYDENGFDNEGYDKQGYDKQGFNRKGCDKQGFDKDGFNCETKLDRAGYDREGCDINGYDKEVFHCKTKLNKEGYNREGFDKDGFNKDGCNKEGITKEGKSCKGKSTNVKLSAEEKIWYNNVLASKNAFFNKIDKDSKEYSMDITFKDESEFASYIAPAVEVDNGIGSSENANGEIKPPSTEVINDANIEIPTGTMLYGQIMANMNSDYPGLVRVKILGGPLDQSMLFGEYTVPFIEDPYRPRDKIKMTISQLIYNRNTIPVSAVALDTKSMTDYLSGEVDYHYVTRWGGLIAANILKGIGKAVATGGTTASNDGSGLVYQQPITATTDQLKVAAGEVGSELSTIARQQFDRPPTITKDQGEMIAIFFMQELNDDRIPMIFNTREMQDINQKLMLNPTNKNIKN